MGGNFGRIISHEPSNCHMYELLTLVPRQKHLPMQQRVRQDIPRWALRRPVFGVSAVVVQRYCLPSIGSEKRQPKMCQKKIYLERKGILTSCKSESSSANDEASFKNFETESRYVAS